jgi:mannosyltransferase OCH1-like enzyme
MPIKEKVQQWLMRLSGRKHNQIRKLLSIKDLYNSIDDRESNQEAKPTELIPRQVFQTWKTEYIDEGHYLNLKSYQEENRDYKFFFFDDEDMDEYMVRAWGHHPISSVFKRTRVGAAKADIWRYCLLYDLGGIYLDIDASFKVPLSQIMGAANSEIISFESNQIAMDRARYGKQIDQSLLPFEEYEEMLDRLKERSFPHPEHVVLQWALFFKPRHPILAHVINAITQNASRIEGHVIRDMHKAVCNFTGPIAYSKAVWQYAIGQEVACRGIDFDGLGIPKHVPKKGVYKSDKRHYTKLSGEILLETHQGR